ncbi:MAG: cytochrome c-550 PedF [Pseudomonadota bacterium]
MTKKKGSILAGVAMLCAAFYQVAVWAHGDVTPQPVNTEGLDEIQDWVEENPYRGNDRAVEVGASAYAGNCARCHGLEAVSGGITPDLRALNDEFEWDSPEASDEWFIQRVRHGAVVQGRVYMPPFEGILSQEAMWAIRSYIDSRGQVE